MQTQIDLQCDSFTISHYKSENQDLTAFNRPNTRELDNNYFL